MIEARAVIGPCKIGDGAYIGANAVLLEGCTIGPNVVVSAGAVVPEFADLSAPGIYSVCYSQDVQKIRAEGVSTSFV